MNASTYWFILISELHYERGLFPTVRIFVFIPHTKGSDLLPRALRSVPSSRWFLKPLGYHHGNHGYRRGLHDIVKIIFRGR